MYLPCYEYKFTAKTTNFIEYDDKIGHCIKKKTDETVKSNEEQLFKNTIVANS